jgi:peptide/nickel transport system permease protein
MGFLKRRALTYLSVLLVSVNLDFFLPRLAPSNAAELLAAGSKLPYKEATLIAHRLGLNTPLPTQYYLYLKNIFLTWPPYFGSSYQYYPTTVTDLFFSRLGWTLLLIIPSFLIASLLAYLLAAAGTLRPAGKFETGTIYSSILLQGLPPFWIAMVFLWVFAVRLHLVPMFGAANLNASGLNLGLSILQHSLLPILVLSISLLGEDYLLLRASTVEVLKTDYVTSAKARGLSDRRISFDYILRNSLIPFVSLTSFSVASLISRVVVIESVFGYPGVGDLLVDATFNRDFPVLVGSFFFITILTVIGGMMGDVVLLKLDPRLRG